MPLYRDRLQEKFAEALKAVLPIILIVLILRLIANILVAIFGGRFTTTLALSFYMVSIVLSLVQYIMYLVFLAKAKKMLAQN